MGTPLFKPYKIKKNQLNDIPIEAGQIFFITDIGEVYLDDSNENRLLIFSDSKLLIGDLNELQTQTKENIVKAINEVWGNHLNTLDEILDNTDESKTVGAMALKQFLTGGGSGSSLAAPTAVTLTNLDEAVAITWTDPEDNDDVVWDGTLVVRKQGAPPTDKNDGILVLDSKIRNQHKINEFIDTGLVNNNIYYYGIFPYTTLRAYNYDVIKSIVPEDIFPSSISDVSFEAEQESITITFNKPEDVASVKCVYKISSAPENSSDGTVINNFTSGDTIYNLENDTTYYFKFFTYNEKNRETASEEYNATTLKGLKVVTWANGTWEEISAMLDAHYNNEIKISDYWAVGDEKEIPISTITSTSLETQSAGTYTFVILGFNHDLLESGKKAAISIGMKTTFDTRGIMHNSEPKFGYVTSISSTLRNKWCNNNFKKSLPIELQSLIKPVQKKTYINYENINTDDGISISLLDCWLFSGTEVAGQFGRANSYVDKDSEGAKYEYFDSGTYKTCVGTSYWLRSSCDDGKTVSYSYFNIIIAKFDSWYNVMSNTSYEMSCGIRVGFCL